MTHKLVLDVPEEIYQPLAVSASRSGASLEKRAVEWLAAVGRHAERDPLEKLIGAMPSSVPDWTGQHDQHLGASLGRELGGENLGNK
jgi:hypothetical protein